MRRTNSKFEIRNPKVRGAAIMLALWALFLLSALVIAWALDIQSRLAISGEGTRMLDAEAAACSGAEVALHPSVNIGSANLKGRVDNRSTYDARLTGEGGRLNINYLAGGSAGEAGVEVLKRYLENKGIDLNERNVMIDSLLDWVQLGTGLHHLNAPEESDDYHPAHAALTRVDELKRVFGWAELASGNGWDEDFTVNSSGPVDLNWASREVLLALPGMTSNMVDRFLQLRQGPDGIDGTEDDVHFKSSPEAAPALSIRLDQLQKLEQSRLITFSSNFFRVTSVGTAGHAKRTVQMVFVSNKNAGGGVLGGVAPQVIIWKEF